MEAFFTRAISGEVTSKKVCPFWSIVTAFEVAFQAIKLYFPFTESLCGCRLLPTMACNELTLLFSFLGLYFPCPWWLQMAAHWLPAFIGRYNEAQLWGKAGCKVDPVGGRLHGSSGVGALSYCQGEVYLRACKRYLSHSAKEPPPLPPCVRALR